MKKLITNIAAVFVTYISSTAHTTDIVEDLEISHSTVQSAPVLPQNNHNNFNNVPDEIIMNIADHLNLHDQLRLGMVDHRLYDIMADDRFLMQTARQLNPNVTGVLSDFHKKFLTSVRKGCFEFKTYNYEKYSYCFDDGCTDINWLVLDDDGELTEVQLGTRGVYGSTISEQLLHKVRSSYLYRYMQLLDKSMQLFPTHLSRNGLTYAGKILYSNGKEIVTAIFSKDFNKFVIMPPLNDNSGRSSIQAINSDGSTAIGYILNKYVGNFPKAFILTKEHGYKILTDADGGYDVVLKDINDTGEMIVGKTCTSIPQHTSKAALWLDQNCHYQLEQILNYNGNPKSRDKIKNFKFLATTLVSPNGKVMFAPVIGPFPFNEPDKYAIRIKFY